jgi:hypothetical protein
MSAVNDSPAKISMIVTSADTVKNHSFVLASSKMGERGAVGHHLRDKIDLPITSAAKRGGNASGGCCGRNCKRLMAVD